LLLRCASSNRLRIDRLRVHEHLIWIVLGLDLGQLLVIVQPILRMCLMFRQSRIGVVDIHAQRPGVSGLDSINPTIQEILATRRVCHIVSNTIVELEFPESVTVSIRGAIMGHGRDCRGWASMEIDDAVPVASVAVSNAIPVVGELVKFRSRNPVGHHRLRIEVLEDISVHEQEIEKMLDLLHECHSRAALLYP